MLASAPRDNERCELGAKGSARHLAVQSFRNQLNERSVSFQSVRAFENTFSATGRGIGSRVAQRRDCELRRWLVQGLAESLMLVRGLGGSGSMVHACSRVVQMHVDVGLGKDVI